MRKGAPDDEYGAGSVFDDAVRNAAHQESGRPGEPAGPDNDQIGALGFGYFHDLIAEAFDQYAGMPLNFIETIFD